MSDVTDRTDVSDADVEAEAITTQQRYAHPYGLVERRTRSVRPDAVYLPSTISGAVYARHFTLAGFRKSMARLRPADSDDADASGQERRAQV